MTEMLKTIISTLVLIIITSIVFFALYFLAPDLAEETFGISYRTVKENPIETMPTPKSSSEEDVMAVDNVSDEASQEEVLSDDAKEVSAFLSTSDAFNTLKSSVGLSVENLDVNTLNSIATYLSETGENIADVFSNRNVYNYISGKGSDAIESVIAFLGE